MEPLVTTRKVLTWLRMYSDDNVSSKWKKHGQSAGGLLCLILQLLSFVGTATFAVKFASTNVQKSLFAFMFVTGHFNAAYSITHAMLSRHRIAGLFTRLTKIYGASKLKICTR